MGRQGSFSGNTLWSAVATGANAAFVFALIPVITKLGGMNAYGLWEGFAVLVALLAPVAWLGLRSGFTRYSAGQEDPRTLSAAFHAVLLVVVPAALLLGGLEALAAPLLSRTFFSGDPTSLPLLRVAAGLIAAESVRLVTLEFYRATLRIRAYALLELAQRSAELALVVTILLRGGTIVGCAMAMLAVRLVALVVAYLGAVRSVGLARPDFSRIAPYMAYGLPLLANEFLGRTLKVADRFVIGHFGPVDQLGDYAVPVNLAMALTLYTATLQVWLYPHLSRLWNLGHRQQAVAALDRALRLLLLAALPTVAGLSAIGPQVVTLIANPETAVRTVAVLPLVSTGLMFYGIAALTLYVLTLVERTVLISAMLGGTVVVNLTLNLLLVPRLGILGAGVAHCSAFALLATVMVLVARRHLPVSPLPGGWFLPRVAAACVVMAAWVWAVGQIAPGGMAGLVVAIVGGAAVYAAVVFASGAVTMAELGALRRR
jgi:O-antigen/teichoic acid export membrane protein